MSGRVVFERFYQAMRAAQLSVYAGIALPVTALSLVYVLPGTADTLALMLLALAVWLGVVLVLDVARRSRRVTRRRVASHLDRHYPQLQDSATLLLVRRATLSPVAALQRQRVEKQLLQLQPVLRGYATRRYRWPMVAASGLLAVALVLNLPQLLAWWAQTSPSEGRAAAMPLRLEAVQFDVAPPAYMARETYAVDGADITVPVGSRVRLTARITAASDVAWTPTGRTDAQPLFAANDTQWQSEWWRADATTYALTDEGIAIADAQGVTVHRIALLDDTPPDVRIVTPADRVHTVSDDPQEPLTVTIDVADDFGISDISLSAVLSQGDGEQVSFERQRTRVFEPTGTVRTHKLKYSLDAKALGLQPGGELYVSFVAQDNRTPAAQSSESATLILRWPDATRDADPVLDNQIVAIMPEYFRSQRQLIIDTEALLANADTLTDAEFAQLAQELALDQQALRLRYGAFMGEESSSEPVAGAQSLAAKRDASDEHDEHDEHEQGADLNIAADGTTHFDGDGHDHADDETTTPEQTTHFIGDGHDHADEDFVAAARPGTRAGNAAAAIAPYAHVHDQEEQGTLFDPQTRELLRGALSAMWQSEALLRQHTPKPSLPHQYRALALIKQVQRSSRVFVERIGFEPRPIDMARRLTGELDEIRDRTRLAEPVIDDAAAASARAANAMVQILAHDGIAADDVVQPLLTWLQQSGLTRDAQARTAFLDAEAQLRSWQQLSVCAACRERLSAFWQRYAPEQDRLPARKTRMTDLFERRN